MTKLSLLLKVLEGENEQTIAMQLKLFHERALPDLGNNIKCGNSLTGTDFYDGVQETMPLYEDEEKFTVNAFDWDGKDGFNEIIANGGFDAVIGNPPYGAQFTKDMTSYFQQKYKVSQGELDSYVIFLEAAIKLLQKNGLLGFIVPDTWLTLVNTSQLRQLLIKNYCIAEVDLLNEFIFLTATIDPLLLFIINTPPSSKHVVRINSLRKNTRPSSLLSFDTSSTALQKDWAVNSNYQINVFVTSDNISLINKCKLSCTSLSYLIDYRAGCKPYEVGKGFPPQSKETLSSKPYTSFENKGKGWIPLIRGDDVQRYFIKKKKPEFIKYGKWLAAPREWRVFSGNRILIQAIRNPSIKRRIIAVYTEDDIVSRINVYSLLIKDDVDIQYSFLLGVLNSSLMNWLLTKIYGLHTYVITGVLQLPIKDIDKSNIHLKEKIVSNVNSLLSLNTKLLSLKDGHEKAVIKRQIDATDQRIDDIIYELYGLTEEEINIVKESFKQ